MTRSKTNALEWCLWVAVWTLPVFLHSAFFASLGTWAQYFSFDRTHFDIKDLVLALALIVLLVPLALHGPWPRRFSPLGVLVLVFCASELFAVTRSEYPTQALYRTAFDVLLIAWCWWWWARPDREALLRVLCGLAFGLTALLCLVAFVASWREAPGEMTYNPVGHRYYWAELFIGLAPLACLHPKRLVLWRNGVLLMLPLGALLIVLGRRIPVVGLALAGAAVGAVILFRQYRASAVRIPKKKILIGAAAVLLVFVVGYVVEQAVEPEVLRGPAPGFVSRVLDSFRILASGDLHELDLVRGPMYVQGTKAVFREPLGYGRGTFSLQFFDIAFTDHDPEHPPLEIPSFHPFNTFLHIAVEGGVLAGLVLLVIWGWTLLRLLRRLVTGDRPEHLGYALFAGMVAFSFDSLTFSSIDYPTTRIVWVFYLIATWVWLEGEATEKTPTKPTPAVTWAWRVGGFGFLIVMAFLTGRHYLANNYAVRAEAMTHPALLRQLRDDTARREMLAKANELIDTALASNPDPYEHHLTAANVARNRGDLGGAKTILNDYIEEHPYQVRVLEALAEIRGVEGDAAGKAELERRIREIWPGWTPN